MIFKILPFISSFFPSFLSLLHPARSKKAPSRLEKGPAACALNGGAPPRERVQFGSTPPSNGCGASSSTLRYSRSSRQLLALCYWVGASLGVEAGACWPPRPRLRDRGNPGGAAHSLRCAEPAWPIERAALEPVSKPTVPGARLHGAAGEALGPGAWRQLPQPPSSPPLERAEESRERELGRGPPPETTYVNTSWQSRLWAPPNFSFFGIWIWECGA